MTASSDETAREILETVPLVMRTIRTHMRRSRSHNLSVPQFRALGFMRRNPGSSLSEVAEHIGLTLPSMSKLIDGLVARGLVERRIHPDDRRRITLNLTGKGSGLLRSARESAKESLAWTLSRLSERERAAIDQAMQILHGLFSRPDEGTLP